MSFGSRVEPFDVASDIDVAALHDLQVQLDRERLPDEPPLPLAEFVDDIRIVPRFRDVQRWIVRGRGNSIQGVAELTVNYVDDNQDVAEVWVGVRPDARRQGLGLALLERAVDGAGAAGRTSLDSWAVVVSDVNDATDANDAEGFLERYGFERRYLERHSRLRIADLDAVTMKDWVAGGQERAAGYQLLGWDGPCPDDLLEGYVQVLDVMNTAPKESLDHEDEVFTGDRIRAKEEAWRRAGGDMWVFVARHDETGEIAGLTELGARPHRPWLAVQGNTGVDPRHRRRGIGRWLKAAMILRLIAEKPAVACVDTWNAESNRPMLAINEAMGFKPLQHLGGWQAPLDHVAQRLASRAG